MPRVSKTRHKYPLPILLEWVSRLVLSKPSPIRVKVPAFVPHLPISSALNLAGLPLTTRGLPTEPPTQQGENLRCRTSARRLMRCPCWRKESLLRKSQHRFLAFQKSFLCEIACKIRLFRRQNHILAHGIRSAKDQTLLKRPA